MIAPVYNLYINRGTPTFPVKLGLSYNFYAATDSRNITSLGWHIPTQTELQTLLNYLGAAGNYSTNSVGGKLKEDSAYWLSPNLGATNEVGFNARGSGARTSAGDFTSLQTNCHVGTSTATIANAILMTLSKDNAIAYIGQQSRKQGNSLRPVKDSTTLTHGQTGTYTGNDGKNYRTICINGVEWVADNIAETQFRNGDYIHGYESGVYTPISNAAWAALTTAGVCVYNDDLNNL